MQADITPLSRADETVLNTGAQTRARGLDLAERTGTVVIIQRAREAAIGSLGALRGRLALDTADDEEQLAAVTACNRRLIRPHLREMTRRLVDLFLEDTREEMLASVGGPGEAGPR